MGFSWYSSIIGTKCLVKESSNISKIYGINKKNSGKILPLALYLKEFTISFTLIFLIVLIIQGEKWRRNLSKISPELCGSNNGKMVSWSS